MAGPILRFPITRHYIADVKRFVYRFNLRLEIRNRNGQFVSLPFRLDTGSDFMTIPQWIARKNDIEYSERTALFPKTASGRADQPSFVSSATYSFPELSQWMFETPCVFSPYNLPYCLFSLNDLVPHFVTRSNKESSNFPDGLVVFQLRADHGGQPRG